MKLGIDDTRTVVEDIINSNRMYLFAQEQLKKYGDQFNETLYLGYSIKGLLNIIKNNTENEEESLSLIKEMFDKNSDMIYHYFNSVLRGSVIPRKELQFAINVMMKSVDMIYDILIKTCGNYEINGQASHYWGKCSSLDIHKNVFKHFLPYLEVIYNKFSDKLLKRCRRGIRPMIIYFLLFQDYLQNNDEVFQILISRLKGYKNIQYIDMISDFIIDEEQKKQLMAARTLLEMRS